MAQFVNQPHLDLDLVALYFELHLQLIAGNFVNYSTPIGQRAWLLDSQIVEALVQALDLHSHYTVLKQLIR